MKLIERDFYLETIKRIVGTPDIKVITGVRRSGKSKLLESLKQYCLNNIPEANVIHINFNLAKFENLKDYHALYKYIDNAFVEGKSNFVLIDEVQLCNNFELTINSLHAEEKYDIYITGSNAFLLSSDLATLFTGRTFEIKVYPFSFKEYLEYFATNKANSQETKDIERQRQWYLSDNETRKRFMTWQQEIDDAVYEERERAKAAERRADEEKTRADEEKSRADRYEKILKEHGLL